MILLIVDVQKLIMNDRLYNYEAFAQNIVKLANTARENGVEVIYVRHDDGKGQLLSKGNSGFEIWDGIMPHENEKIFDKNVNSPFKESGLLEYLTEKGEKTLVVTGLQTEYCIDATIKCGFEHGFEVIVPENANTTTDNAYMSGEDTYRYYNKFIWKNRYAKCVTIENAIEILKGDTKWN